MLKYIVGRLMALVPILLGVSVVAFLLVKLIPGDPVQAMLGLEATPEAIRTLRHQYGFDRPLYEQFSRWLWRVLRGDLGNSVQTMDENDESLVVSSHLNLTEQLSERDIVGFLDTLEEAMYQIIGASGIRELLV